MSDREDCEGEEKEEEICPTQRDVEELKRKLKAPDRGKFDRELEKINVGIRGQEAKLRGLQSSRSPGSTSSHDGKDRDTLMTELRGYKAERQKEIDVRKKIDQELKGVNSLVQQKNDACGRLQACLKYKTEARADEAIRRLEHQMRVQQLKLREEKRLVSEIDALKRSKKQIHEFDALKHEISQLRDKQNALRKQRDNCMRTNARLKSKEEEIKTLLDEQRSKDGEVKQQMIGFNIEKNALKKEIDELYTRKRALVNTFHKEKEEYNALLKDIREQERQIKREVEAMKRIEERHTNRKQHGGESPEQFINAVHEKMIGVCDSLIVFINGLTGAAKTDDSESTSDQQTATVQATDTNFSGGSFLKKKSDNDLEEMYGGSAGRKSNRRSSRKGKKSTQKENVPKKLVLHPLVLEQFFSVGITPPSTAADCPKVMQLMIEKKTNLLIMIDVPVDPLPRSPSSTSSGASSLENFPSLPSQQEATDTTEVKELHKITNEKNEEHGLGNDEILTEETQPLHQQQQQQQQQQPEQHPEQQLEQQQQEQQQPEQQQQQQQPEQQQQQQEPEKQPEQQNQQQQQQQLLQQQLQQQQQLHQQENKDDVSTMLESENCMNKQTEKYLQHSELEATISSDDKETVQITAVLSKPNEQQKNSNENTSNILENTNQNGPLNLEEKSLQNVKNTAPSIESSSKNSIMPSTGENYCADNHVNTKNGDDNVACSSEVKFDDREDHAAMIENDNLTSSSNGKPNSPIQCPS